MDRGVQAFSRLLQGTALCDSFRREPLAFIDIGARGGAHPVVEPAAELIRVLGFEPDEEELARLQANQASLPFADARYSPYALADRAGDLPLYLCEAPTNHSLNKPNEPFCRRYAMVKFALVGETQVRCATLDDVLASDELRPFRAAELIKIDTQGSELEILSQARRALAGETVAILTEVSFSPIYEKHGLFSELELFLRGQGFSFHGFDRLHYRSRKSLDKHRQHGRERLLYSDAVFFRDPFDHPDRKFSRRNLQALFLTAALLGFHDFALELAAPAATTPEERATLENAVHLWARREPPGAAEAVFALREKLSHEPERAAVWVGRFIDERRTQPDYDDVVLRAPDPVLAPPASAAANLNVIPNSPDLEKTDWAREWPARPLGFIDIGARGGGHAMVEPMAKWTKVLAFTPDAAERERLLPELAKSNFAQVELRACGIAGRDGEAELHLLANPVNHSLLGPNARLAGRYAIRGFHEVGVARVPCRSLDSLLLGDTKNEPDWGEFLKIDARGGELSILQAARKVLAARTMTLSLAAGFFPTYLDQPLFSEIELFLRGQGFILYGFHALHHRSQKRLDKKVESGRERLFCTDAVFFRDPLDPANAGTTFSPRQWRSLLAGALLLRYYDYALELLESPGFPETNKEALRAAIHRLAAISPEAMTNEVDELHAAVAARPDLANILVGKFIDARRAWPDYDEIRG
jgi:FkbM family methyltransferase